MEVFSFKRLLDAVPQTLFAKHSAFPAHALSDQEPSLLLITAWHGAMGPPSSVSLGQGGTPLNCSQVMQPHWPCVQARSWLCPTFPAGRVLPYCPLKAPNLFQQHESLPCPAPASCRDTTSGPRSQRAQGGSSILHLRDFLKRSDTVPSGGLSGNGSPAP